MHHVDDRRKVVIGVPPREADPGALHEEIRADHCAVLKRAEAGGAVIVRLYNVPGEAARAQLRGIGITRAWKVNLNEEGEEKLSGSAEGVPLHARGGEILTLRLEPQGDLLMGGDGRRIEIERTRCVTPPELEAALPSVPLPPLITLTEVEAEHRRLRQLEKALRDLQKKAFQLEEDLERKGEPSPADHVQLQRLKAQVSTLARQAYEARISWLLARQLLLTRQLETEFEEIGEPFCWTRIKKRLGEFLISYYENLSAT